MIRDPLDLLNLTYVQRWSIVPMQRSQSVGEHTFRVLVIAKCLMEEVPINEMPRLYPASYIMSQVLYHDAEEVLTGDMPGPSKPALELPDLELVPMEDCIVKVADALECLTWWKAWGPNLAQWPHPWNPAGARDLQKFYHYTKKSDSLAKAAHMVYYTVTGGTHLPAREMEHIFGGR